MASQPHSVVNRDDGRNPRDRLRRENRLVKNAFGRQKQDIGI
jgi:hypothetical protein